MWSVVLFCNADSIQLVLDFGYLNHISFTHCDTQVNFSSLDRQKFVKSTYDTLFLASVARTAEVITQNFVFALRVKLLSNVSGYSLCLQHFE